MDGYMENCSHPKQSTNTTKHATHSGCVCIIHRAKAGQLHCKSLNVHHVKRIQKKSLEGGKTQIMVILCLACENESIPQTIQELIHCHNLIIFSAKVCKYAATSKEEWEEQCKLWPTSYHPPTYNTNGITGFSDEDCQSIFAFMKCVVELAKSGTRTIVNAAIIVDPLVKKIIASARDQVLSWDYCSNRIGNGCDNVKQAEGTSSHDGSVGIGRHGSFANGSSNELKHLYSDICCLYPWQWAEKQQRKPSSGYHHPLQHAAVVAIEASSARDRHLLPSLGPSRDRCCESYYVLSSCIGSPEKRLKTNFTNVGNENQLGHPTEGSHSFPDRPYLCTGYDMYLAWEPCTMVYRLQGEKSLNHHYAVFRVLLPEQVFEKNEAIVEGNHENDLD